MKNIIIITSLLVMIFAVTVSAAENGYHTGYTEGERLAERQHSALAYWLVGTPASFFLSPLIGGGATIATAYLTSPRPESRELRRLEQEGYSREYIHGVEDGYENIAKSKNTTAAWGSAGIGFAARLVLMAVAQSATNNQLEPIQNEIPVFEVGFSF